MVRVRIREHDILNTVVTENRSGRVKKSANHGSANLNCHREGSV